MKDSVIITDCDGVLLSWEYAFAIWMTQHGFEQAPGSEYEYSIGSRYNISDEQGEKLIKIFNESAAIGFLPPLRDAMHYVKRLHEEHGFVFHCITSLSTDPNAKKLREMNLSKLFGDTVFEEVVCLETGADKDQALLPYQGMGCYWVEDRMINAVAGAQLGLNSLLMVHGHNMNERHENVRPVKHWRDIFQIITEEVVEL